MSLGRTYVAREDLDPVLLEDDFTSIVSLFRLGLSTSRNLKRRRIIRFPFMCRLLGSHFGLAGSAQSFSIGK